MKRALFGLVILLLVGCKSEPAVDVAASPAPGPDEAAASPTPGRKAAGPEDGGVKLEVSFEGLIAFVDQTHPKDQSPPVWWALMADARNIAADKLPPCGDTFHWEDNYKVHLPGIVIEGAKLKEGTGVEDLGDRLFVALDDHDVIVDDGLSDPTFPDTANELKIDLLTKSPLTIATHLDPIRRELVSDDHDLTSGNAHPKFGDGMSARVRLTGADTLEAKVNQWQPGRVFGFNTSTPSACNEPDGGFVQLTEDFIATRAHVAEVTLSLRQGKEQPRLIRLAPADGSQAIRIVFRNDLADPAILKRGIDKPVDMAMPHFESHRWFHLLSANPADIKAPRCSYIPCLKTGPSGSPICPMPMRTPKS